MERSVYYYIDSSAVGGAEEALLALLGRLDRARWTPTLLHHDEPGIAELLERAEALDVARRVVPPLPLGLGGARNVPAFVRELRRRPPDLFHAQLTWPLDAKWALLGAVAAGVPALATVQLFPHGVLDRSNRLQLAVLGRRVDRWIAVSSDIAQRLRETFRLPASKIEVVTNGVAAAPPRPRDEALRRELGGAPGRPLVLLVARLEQQKGIDVLLRAAVDVDASFAVAGDGAERAELERRAVELGVADRVRFLGRRTDVGELLAAADVFALPSRYEGTSLALLEAMAAGKPVVATAIGGNDEIVEDGRTGLLVPAEDPRALAAALARLAGDAATAAALGAAARAEVERRFSWDAVAARVGAIYEQVADG